MAGKRVRPSGLLVCLCLCGHLRQLGPFWPWLPPGVAARECVTHAHWQSAAGGCPLPCGLWVRGSRSGVCTCVFRAREGCQLVLVRHVLCGPVSGRLVRL